MGTSVLINESWYETLEGLQSSAEVVGADEVGEMPAELVVVIVVEALERNPITPAHTLRRQSSWHSPAG